MRIRAAGGLLLAPVLYPVAVTLDQLGSRVSDENLERALRYLFWTGAIALGLVPWVIYDVRGLGDLPPRWVADYQLWYPMGRYAALLWILVLVAAALLAATDFARRPDPSYAGGPLGPPGAPTADRSPRPAPVGAPGAYAGAERTRIQHEVPR